MRIRSIKPDFWHSESVGKLSRDARLLFIGLWNLADDQGRFRGNLAIIRGALFPYDAEADIQSWMTELEALGMVRRWVHDDGNTYGDIPKFAKHQVINRPSASRLPEFPESSPNLPGVFPEDSRRTHGGLTEDSRTEREREREVEREQGSQHGRLEKLLKRPIPKKLDNPEGRKALADWIELRELHDDYINPIRLDAILVKLAGFQYPIEAVQKAVRKNAKEFYDDDPASKPAGKHNTSHAKPATHLNQGPEYRRELSEARKRRQAEQDKKAKELEDMPC